MTTNSVAIDNQRKPFFQRAGQWFVDKVVGALVVALIIYIVSFAARISREDIIHFLGGVTPNDLVGYVRYDDAIYISKIDGARDHSIIVDSGDAQQFIKIFGPEQVNYPERAKFSIRQWPKR